jgi:hypothetical protein
MKQGIVIPQEIEHMKKLPDEAGIIPFIYLNEQELAQARLVCRQWNNFAQDKMVWREKIKERFPYLKLRSRERFENEPKELYQEEYQLLKKYQKLEIKLPSGLTVEKFSAILKGDVTDVEPEQILLYALAYSNGYYHVIENDQLDKNRMINKALKLAIAVGNYSVANHIIHRAKEQYTANQCCDEIQGESDVYEIYHGGERLKEACLNGCEQIVNFILENKNDAVIIADVDFISAVSIAAINRHFKVVDLLLKHISPAILEIAIQKTLDQGIKAGNIQIVQYFLKFELSTPTDYAFALCEASAHGQLAIVEFLLDNKEITLVQKKLALDIAHSNKHTNVADAILQNINLTPVSIENKNLKIRPKG